MDFIVCVFLFVSCKETDVKSSELDRTIEKMIEVSTEDGYSDYMYLPLFKQGNIQNELVYFTIDELRRLYFGKHITDVTNQLTFEKFVKNVIENKINLGCDILGECFIIDENIKDEYKILGFNKFKEKYTYKTLSDKEIVMNINDLESEQILNVIYFFYLNNYFSYWGDYEGWYFSDKILDTDISEFHDEIIVEEL